MLVAYLVVAKNLPLSIYTLSCHCLVHNPLLISWLALPVYWNKLVYKAVQGWFLYHLWFAILVVNYGISNPVVFMFNSKLLWLSLMCNIFWAGGIIHMMTSSNGNIFSIPGPLCMEFTGHRWIPLTKAGDVEPWCFPWSSPEKAVE